jgi:myo-inositol 2-dehydrogenase/D-chiro-inositol 1-dehydrogenase
MVAEAVKHKVKFMVGFNMRFRTGFMRLKEITDSGRLGDVVTYWCQRMGLRVDPNNKWSTDPVLMTGMSIQSLSHDIDMMRWVAGEVVDVRAQIVESRPHLPGFDDNANAVFALANGGKANFQASWSSHLAMNTRGVIGTKGTAYIRGASLWNIDTFHWKTEDMPYEQIEVINDIHDVRSFLAEDRYFIDCVENDIEPTVTGLDGLKALKVSYGILASHKQNKVVSLT